MGRTGSGSQSLMILLSEEAIYGIRGLCTLTTLVPNFKLTTSAINTASDKAKK